MRGITCWWATRILVYGWWECKLTRPSWNPGDDVYIQLNIHLFKVTSTFKYLNVSKTKAIYFPCDPAIPCLSVHPKERNALAHTRTCAQMHTNSFTPLLTTAKHWKWPKCPSTGEWINKCNGMLSKNKKNKLPIWHECVSEAACWVEEARLTRLFPLWLRSCGILGETTLWGLEEIGRVCSGRRGWLEGYGGLQEANGTAL